MRVGVLVVAYNAAATLDAHPRPPAPSFAARSTTSWSATTPARTTPTRWACATARRSLLPLTVVRHERNLGYGGNQKAGYHWAIEHGLDVVVLLHGDGQYAPECHRGPRRAAGPRRGRRRVRLPDDGARRAPAPAACRSTSTSATDPHRGSRTRSPGSSSREWHSGYRAYRVDALADLDLDAVLRRLRLRHRDHPGPPRRRASASSRCRSRPTTATRSATSTAMKYAKDVTADVLRYWARRMGFGGGSRARPQTPTSTTSSRPTAPPTACCSSGSPGTRRPACSTSAAPTAGSATSPATSATTSTGVDLVKHDGVAERRRRLRRGRPQPGAPGETRRPTTTSIVAGDILEHVVDPARAADATSRDQLAPGGEILVSVPELRPLVPPRPDRRSAASTTTSAARSTAATSASSPAAPSSGWSTTAACGSSSATRRHAGRGARPRSARRSASRARPWRRPRRPRRDSARGRRLFGYQFLYRLEPA